ncbi:DNA gyrase subunit A [Defluviitalea raffinosedens]|uniref:Topoisomerase IV n=1 Tax=Defluviitalea raffinosedens TaxID=1450156 RepID=A0A7C8HHP9_9FIRM|nr:DNA gyrase subunit A [Defluviitalea raffinosedens]KAE9633469.1 topoisomerase IV [Defluviitalea raffinosedens]MBM7685939.1 DNA gyrase subunit A [Defluviitalea raffinosedens]
MGETLISTQKITDTLKQNYMPYAMSVIVSRAIPEIDGFKPAHRKLLYTMYKMGLLQGGKTKSANIVGQTMRLNPHGDQAIYETMVRLTVGAETLLVPFIDSKGNFGKQYSRDMAYAAPRYTEAKLAPICKELFADIDKNTVEFVDNYDGTMKEPTLLPTTFPNILVNPNQGIAVGMASNICSFNLREVCQATIAYLKNEKTDVCQYLKAPDFPGGGKIIYNGEEMRTIYETGRGSFKIRAVYNYDAKNNYIEITQIPYTTTVEAIIDKLVDLIKIGKIKEVNDIRDETDLGGLKLTLDLKRNTDPDELMKKLYTLTPLEDSFNCNFNILIDGHPRVMGIKEILSEWIKFRIKCIRRKSQFELDRKSEKLHLLLGLEQILLDIDKAIKIIRDTEKEKDVVPNLMAGFQIDEKQAEFIAEIKLRNLNKEYILKRIAEADTLRKEIESLKKLIQDDKKIKKVIEKELQRIEKEYGEPRKSEIIEEEKITSISKEDLIDDYGVKIFLTEHQYIKKISHASYRANSTHALKDGDRVLQEIEVNNKGDILLFSDKQNVYRIKAYELEDCKASNLGDYLPNVLEMEEDEHIIFISEGNTYAGYILIAFENGKLIKIPLKYYETKQYRRKLVGGFYGRSKCVRILPVMEDIDILLVRNDEKAALINTSLIPVGRQRQAAGVQSLKMGKKTFLKTVLAPDEYDETDMGALRAKELPAQGKEVNTQLKLNL